IECLEKMVANSHVNDTDSVRGLAFSALVSARAVKKDSLRLALKEDWWQTRRQAVLVLAGGASDLDAAERASRIADALADPEAHVRYEALRAHLRVSVKTDGCGRVLDLMN